MKKGTKLLLTAESALGLIAFILGIIKASALLLTAAVLIAAAVAVHFALLNQLQHLEQSKKDEAQKVFNMAEMERDRHGIHMRKNIISRIIDGDLWNEMSILEMVRSENVYLGDDYYLVAKLSFIPDGQIFSEPANLDNERQMRLASYAVINISQEVLARYGIAATAMRIHREPLCVVTYKDSPNFDKLHAEQRLEQAFSEVVTSLDKLCGINIRVYSGQIHLDPMGIKLSYDEAESIKEHSIFMRDTKPVIFSSQVEVPMPEPDDSIAAIATQKQVFNCIESGDYTRAYEHLVSMLDTGYFTNASSVSVLRLRAYSLINIALDAGIASSGADDNEFIEQVMNMVQNLNVEDFPQFKIRIQFIFKMIIDYVKGRPAEPQPAWYPDMMRFIDKNYTDPNLNVAAVSEVVNMSPAYISRMAKKYEGFGLWDYIQRKRVDRAKAALAQGKNVMLSAKESGFSNPRSMTRAFIKFEGITPGRMIGVDNKLDEPTIN